MTAAEQAAARRRQNERQMEARLKKMAEDQARHEMEAVRRQKLREARERKVAVRCKPVAASSSAGGRRVCLRSAARCE
jgi:hypothetical protein